MLKRTPCNALAIIFFFVLMQKLGRNRFIRLIRWRRPGAPTTTSSSLLTERSSPGLLLIMTKRGALNFAKKFDMAALMGFGRNGFPKFRAEWKEGYGHGGWQYFYPNGRLRQDEYYDMDTPVGVHTVYYSNGQVKSRGAYEEGKKHGDWQLLAVWKRQKSTQPAN